MTINPDPHNSTGSLYLIPSSLGEGNPHSIIPASVREVIERLDYFLVENPKSARRYLSWFNLTKPLQQLSIQSLEELKNPADIDLLLTPLFEGHNVGILSDAGCPCIADPGALVVRQAHKRGVRVVPLVGPSSILLALIASGLNGQSFAFHGYLPAKPEERREALKTLERNSRSHGQTQIFMETPYRSEKVLTDVLSVCAEDTTFSVASNLTLPDELIMTKQVKEWRLSQVDLKKRLCIFLLLAGR